MATPKIEGEVGFPIETVQVSAPSALAPHPVIRQHLEWLERESRVHNLTAVSREDWMERHVLDSWVPTLAGWDIGDRFLDLGTGAGFPGLPLAAYHESVRFTLLESKAKLAGLLSPLVASLPLHTRGEVVAERAEVMGHWPDQRGRYSVVVTRAVAALPVLIELGIPFLREGGELWAWKSSLGEVSEAGAALSALSAKVSRALCYRLPSEERDRFVVAIRRAGDIDPRFPRKPGIPAKRPLGSR